MRIGLNRAFLRTYLWIFLALLSNPSTSFSAALDCRSVTRTSLFSDQQKATRLEERELTVMAWNLNNVFERSTALTGKYDNEALGDKGGKKNQTENKPEHEIRRIRDQISEAMPDFAIFTEVENVTAMRKLLENDSRLEGRYHIFLKNGNDSRGIDICIVVKKELGLRYKFDTYKDLRWEDQGQEGPLFSRDLPALRIYQLGDKQPSLILMGNHAKSQRDRDGDPRSSRWRTAQYDGIAKISDQYAEQFAGVPQILGGDFNINVIKSNEIQAIRGKLNSAYDLVPKAQQIPVEDRITHWFFPMGGAPVRQQLDDIRIRGGVQVLDAQILPLRDKLNQPLEEGPQSFKERERLASDHAPLVVKFRIFRNKK